MKEAQNSYHTLPAGFCLNDTYLIQNTLGEGGFGITYRCVHKITKEQFAIKEYFPSCLAVRTRQEGIFSLQAFPEKNQESFEKGRRRFLNEAQILKEFQELESIVSVYDLFEQNGTAYLVMEYIEGLTLNEYVSKNGVFTFPEILNLLSPVIKSLSKIHERGLIHRDISPDNLIIGTDNKLHLIDFGAASWEAHEKIATTVILKAGYAPPEQYIANGKVGTWIDVYALCATMYFSITGKAPSEAIHRLDQDSLEPLTHITGLLPSQRMAIEKGLQIRPADRFRNMAELYGALTDAPELDSETTVMGANLSSDTKKRIRKLHVTNRIKKILVTACIACLLVLGTYILTKEPTKQVASSPTANPAATAVPTKETVTASPSPVPDSFLQVPKLTGLTNKEAKHMLNALDSSIEIRISRIYDETKKKGTVLSQSIEPDTYFTKGNLPSILLTVSKGKEPSATSTPIITVTPKPASESEDDYQVKSDEDDYVSIPLE